MMRWLLMLVLGSVHGLSACDRGDDVIRVHIGSCNDNEEGWSQPFWKIIAERQPDGFFWSGDIVYGDHDTATTTLSTTTTAMRLRKK
jgi:phosphodiesterase/alkaline phosphatase D-like protein